MAKVREGGYRENLAPAGSDLRLGKVREGGARATNLQNFSRLARRSTRACEGGRPRCGGWDEAECPEDADRAISLFREVTRGARRMAFSSDGLSE